ncbi:MAG TPA: Rid family detoxifying hydrolase [Candidatus Acidoferrales bacterium]|nr:Rid family detoxifying hydrolase [Candidatus Acidoferrales bacterium]
MRIISSPAAPKPVAAYSQAVEANGFLFTAGQLGIDPAAGALPAGIEAQAEQVFANLRAILDGAGSRPDQVVKVSIFLADLSHFAVVNAAYERFVGAHRPARTTIGAAALPQGALIEVDLVAVAPKS